MIVLDGIKQAFSRKVDATGLALFRISYAIIMYFEFYQLFHFRNIMYDKVPFVLTGEINVGLIFVIWTVINTFLFFGLFTRFATIVNCILGVIVFSSARDFEYHVFYAYVGINFVLMFLPLSRVLSIDSLIAKLKYSEKGRRYNPDRSVLEINYLAVVFVAIGLIYLDSVFQKSASQMWLHGLGVWMPSSLPLYVWHDTSWILNFKWLMLFLGYLVLAFEMAFIFLMWIPKIRVPVTLFGVFFHLGILICFPIPLFALTYVAVYLLMVPQRFWVKMLNVLRINKTIYRFYYDMDCPLCNKIIIVIDHLDFFRVIECVPVQGNYTSVPQLREIPEMQLLINIHGVTRSGKVSVGYGAYIQLFKSLIYLYPLGFILSLPGISHLGKKIYAYIAGDRLTERCTDENCSMPHYSEIPNETKDFLVAGWNKLAFTRKFWKVLLTMLFIQQCIVICGVFPMKDKLANIPVVHQLTQMAYKTTAAPFREFVGITTHAVFTDYHFRGFDHAIKVMYVKDGKRTLVPIIDENGMPSKYDVAILWRNVSFNVLTGTLEQNKIEKGIEPYLKFYLQDYKIPGKSHHFEFYFNETEVPTKWEYDFLRRQMAKPWIKAGDCILTDSEISFVWTAAMKKVIVRDAAERDARQAAIKNNQ